MRAGATPADDCHHRPSIIPTYAVGPPVTPTEPRSLYVTANRLDLSCVVTYTPGGL